jgi:hypothetical protein
MAFISLLSLACRALPLMAIGFLFTSFTSHHLLFTAFAAWFPAPRMHA